MTLRDTDDDRFSRWGNRLSWLLVPLAAGMQLVWLRRPITGADRRALGVGADPHDG